MSDDDRPVRKHLHHDVPHWVEEGARFFITVNCAERNRAQLTPPQTAAALMDAARFYHDQHKWHIVLFLLMPDHWHAIMSFPRDAVMADLFKHWKRFTAQRCDIHWQDRFFDHRLRDDRAVAEKHHYIRHNPVRKQFCATPEDWPHQMHWTSSGLVIGAW